MTHRARNELSIPSLDALRAEFARVAADGDPHAPSRRVRPVILPLALLVFVITAVATQMVWQRSAEEPQVSSPSPDAPAAETEPSGEGQASTPPAPPGFAAHGAAYQTVREIAQASDLVVIGTPTGTRVVDSIGEGPDDPFPTRTLHTSVVIDQVLRGSPPNDTVIVATAELAFQGPGIEDWRTSSRRVLLFLSESRESEGRYIPVEFAFPQAAYFVEGQRIEMTIGGDVEGLSQRIASMTVPELKGIVRPRGYPMRIPPRQRGVR